MQQKIKTLKFTIKTNTILFTALTCFLSLFSTAQEIISDDSTKVAVTNTKDSLTSFQTRKIDGVAAVVGDYIILDSDIDKTILELKASGASLQGVSRCQLFGKMLEDKLYAHHAVQDSIEVTDAEIRSSVDYQLQQMMAQSGKSMEELIAFYNRKSEKELREEMFEINKSERLAGEMQKKIVSELEVTPEEVREFFNKIPESERPTFGTELKVSQIVIEPEVSEENRQRAINQLKQFKADVQENGANFRSKVVLYSDDQASKANGGLYTLNRNKPRMVKEFREAAFSLQEGEISDPFETDFGFHIVYLEKVRGQEYDVRHILLIPEVSQSAVREAREKIENIRERIVSGDISFEDAARESSDEKETRSEGGFLINPATQDYNFELTKMDPELYGQIQDLEEAEISPIITETTRTGIMKFKIMRVTDRVNEHVADYSKDYLKIKELALNEKRFKAIEKWQDEKIMDTYIKINGEYKDCDFSGNWLKQ
ncbi:peptidylprolyl isomerase [Mangrovimonas spongiae]|uniref:Peptidylprolyl isomerase n=1 Tax=Mangrovimonas spongiae TaxID=2494697 RepID=A0A3R9NMI1_9FLAO|nr:peptidylprolyl isomerase [Mangrovimonas spongiae]